MPTTNFWHRTKKASAYLFATSLLINFIAFTSSQAQSAEQGLLESEMTQLYGVQLSTGDYNSCAVLAPDLVKCWGRTDQGRLGSENLEPMTEPKKVGNFTDAIAVSTGDHTSCVLNGSGTVACWQVQVLSSEFDLTKPALVPGIDNAKAIASSQWSNCALLEDGNVECWIGSPNYYWDPVTNSEGEFRTIKLDISNVVAISSGSSTEVCFVLEDRTVRCWNLENYYAGKAELGQTYTVSGLSNVETIAVGYTHSCAVLTSGLVNCWGQNTYYALGNKPISSRGPLEVKGISGAVSVAVSDEASCAVVEGGSSYCWGSTQYGQLGRGFDDRNSIGANRPVLGFTDAVKIYGGRSNFCGVSNSGSVICWGDNNQFQLGFGLREDIYSLPGRVKLAESPIRSFVDALELLDFPKLTTGTATDYKYFYRKTNQANWIEFADTVSTTRSIKISKLTKGSKYFVKVIPITDSTRKVELIISASTLGLSSNSIQVVDSDGYPVSGGSFTWESLDKKSKSSVPVTATSLGVVSFTIPGKPVKIIISGKLNSGSKDIQGREISGSFVFDPAEGSHILTLPRVPEKVSVETKVLLPSGNPVPGAKVVSSGLAASIELSDDAFTGKALNPSHTNSVVTSSSGIATLSGWGTEPTIIATYDDGSLYQKTDSTVPVNGKVELTLDYLPLLTIEDSDLDAQKNQIVTLPVSVVDSAGIQPSSIRRASVIGGQPVNQVPFFTPRAWAAKYKGVKVSLKPPANAPQTACSKAKTLSATTGSNGKANLKFCSSGSGVYTIQTSGAISAGSVFVRVKGAPATQPKSLAVLAENNKATVAWAKPDYTGGTSVTSYTVTATSAGQKTIVKTVKSGSQDFKNLATTFTLAGQRKWSFTITATTRYGVSVSSTTSKAIPGTPKA